MNDEINAVIAMLEAAKAQPAAEAKATINQAVDRLIVALKKDEAPDLDPGPGN